jgi:hypothetical protein
MYQRQGHITGYNNNSGLLYIQKNGLGQFKIKSNKVPSKGLSLDKYSNKKNEDERLKQMNADGDVDFYEGNKETIKVPKETLPPNEPATGGKTQKQQPK